MLRIAILLFDSIGPTRFHYSQNALTATLFRRPDHYTPNFEPIASTGLWEDYSLRSSLLQQLQSTKFLDALAEDSSIILWALLKRVAVDWQEIITSHEFAVQDEGGDDSDFTDDNWMIWRHTESTSRCQDDLKMLKASYAVIECGGPESLRYRSGTHSEEVVGELRVDFADLIERTEKCISGYRHRITLLAAIRSIHESEKAIKQSNTIG